MKTEFKLYDEVFHPEIYYGQEIFTVIGIREDELEMQGDWSGGTHDINQRSWHKLEGTILHKRNGEIINKCKRIIYEKV